LAQNTNATPIQANQFKQTKTIVNRYRKSK